MLCRSVIAVAYDFHTKYINTCCGQSVECLGAFEKLQKNIIGFVKSVRPSVTPTVRMEQLGSHWTDFHEILYLKISRKYVWKIQVALKSDKSHVFYVHGFVHRESMSMSIFYIYIYIYIYI